MPFIWRSANASQTSLICLKESEKGHWMSENIICVFMVAPSTRWSGLYHQQQVSLSHRELRQQENWKFKGNAGSEAFSQGCSCSAVLHIHQLIPRQHGFPVIHCCIPQILKSKAFSAALMWLYCELPRPHFCVCAWLGCIQTPHKARQF